MQLVRIPHVRPYLIPHPLDRRSIQRTEVVRRRGPEGATRVDGLGATFFERHVVQEGVRPRVDHLVGERRWLDRIPGLASDTAVEDATQYLQESVDVHRFDQAVIDRLSDQRVIGDLAVSRDILQAGQTFREDTRQ